MDLDTKGLDVVRAVRATREVGQIELDLVPPVVQPHRHRADERLHTGFPLVVGRPEPPPNTLVVKYLDFEGEVLLQLDHVVARGWHLDIRS